LRSKGGTESLGLTVEGTGLREDMIGFLLLSGYDVVIHILCMESARIVIRELAGN
jgi:hypothetical protein